MADQKGSPPPAESSVKILFGFPSPNPSSSSISGNTSEEVEKSTSVTPSDFASPLGNPRPDSRFNETYVVMPMTSTPKIKGDFPKFETSGSGAQEEKK